MKKNPITEKQITVAIAAYNMEEYLPRALDSVLGFGRRPDEIEVLLVDDGSDDGTFSVAKKYEEEYPGIVRVIKKQNGGYGSVVNRALKEAKGRYFRLLDADDGFDIKGFQKLEKLLRGCEADILVNPFYRDKGDQRILYDVFSGYGSGLYPPDELRPSKALSMHALTVRTSCLRPPGHLLPENCLYTDAEFTAMALCGAKSIYVSHFPVYIHYLDRPGQSVEIKNMLYHFMDHEKVLFRCCDLYRLSLEHGNRRLIGIMIRELVYTQLKLYYMKKISRRGFAMSRRFLKRLEKKVPHLYRSVSGSSLIFRMFTGSAAPVFYPFLHYALRFRYGLKTDFVWDGSDI
jgi:glycosyltransferase involved in cell wall biosynthesis